jgi:AraC-like DNA-binding protein
MRKADTSLSETDIRSPRAKAWMVRADERDLRTWLKSAPVCSLLGNHQISHVGVASMPDPFRIVRSKLGGSYFLACHGGEGRVLIDGRWLRCRAGQAFLLPPGTLHAFHTSPGKTWDIVWVRYHERAGQRPMASANSPVLARFDSAPLRHAILGLHHECSTTAVPADLDLWVRLVQSYVQRFAQPVRMDERIGKLWEMVAADLSHPWTIDELARTAHMSEKQFQRLCRRELGRSPRQQLIWLRIRRAAELLSSGGDKIATIAAQVGYQNPFVFSSTFKRCLGWPPSEYPGRK